MKTLKQMISLRPATPQDDFGKCHDCHTKAFSLFCILCQHRFCAEHIDDRKIHVCGLSGLTKKKLTQLAKLRAIQLSELEQHAIESGRQAAEERRNARKENTGATVKVRE
jgi:hypothetical protein